MMTDTSQGEFAASVTDARLRHPWVHVNRCVACHGVRSHVVPVALVGESARPELN